MMEAIVPPAPGSTPMTKPMMPPRQIGPIERCHSSRVSQSLPLILIIFGAVPLKMPSIPLKTSDTANKPTTTTTKPTPSWNSGIFIV
jgi:hypothetical protein